VTQRSAIHSASLAAPQRGFSSDSRQVELFAGCLRVHMVIRPSMRPRAAATAPAASRAHRGWSSGSPEIERSSSPHLETCLTPAVHPWNRHPERRRDHVQKASCRDVDGSRVVRLFVRFDYRGGLRPPRLFPARCFELLFGKVRSGSRRAWLHLCVAARSSFSPCVQALLPLFQRLRELAVAAPAELPGVGSCRRVSGGFGCRLDIRLVRLCRRANREQR
jgi:hypothetical protein